MRDSKQRIRSAISFYSKIVYGPLLKFFKRRNRSGLLSEQLLVGACKAAEEGTPVYASCMLRARKPGKSLTSPIHSSGVRLAVILQGPLDLNDHFTLNTIRYYRNALNIEHVILSTWSNEDAAELEKIRDCGGIVVLSEYPSCPGIGHANYQLASMQAGIAKALELGADFICKTRTDQRIYNEYAFDLMRNLLVQFPPFSQCRLKYRLLALGDHFDCMFFPYYIGDFLYFGHRDDMRYFLSVGLDTRSVRPPFTCYQERCRDMTNAEIYLMKNFIKASGGQYEDSILSYWNFVKESLVLLDKGIVGLYWHKYDDRYCEHRRNASLLVNGVCRGTDVFSFSSWLSLYNGQLKYDPDYEKLLQINFREMENRQSPEGDGR